MSSPQVTSCAHSTSHSHPFGKGSEGRVGGGLVRVLLGSILTVLAGPCTCDEIYDITVTVCRTCCIEQLGSTTFVATHTLPVLFVLVA